MLSLIDRNVLGLNKLVCKSKEIKVIKDPST